jgi:uncharacterized surface protein with fasciclin (FAS1) repeats
MRRVIPFLFSLVILVAACGDKSESSANEPKAEPAANQEQPKSDEKVTESKDAPDSIVGKILANPDLSTFAQLAESVGVLDEMRKGMGFTTFAPNNAAFAALDAATLEKLKSDKKLLRNALAGHMIMGTYKSDLLKTKSEVETFAQGRDKYAIKLEGDTLTIGGAKIVAADMEGSGQVLHVIDKVLVPASFDPSKGKAPMGVNFWYYEE